MITLAKFSAEYIMPLVGHNMKKITFSTEHGTFKVKANSDRLECFKRNRKCVSCGCIGSVFLLQSHIIGENRNKISCHIQDCEWCAIHTHSNQIAGEMATPHLNMFHVGPRGGLVLMTKDHIVPKCLGGEDNINNLQTMCTYCNSHKGAFSFDEFAANGFRKMNHSKHPINARYRSILA